MAALKKSEKRLLVLFAAAIFCVANFLVVSTFAGRRQAAESEISNYQGEIDLLEPQKQKKLQWLATRAKLNLMEPAFVSEEVAATEIENHLKQCEIYSGATIDQIRPDPPIIDSASRYTKVPLGVKLSGSDEQVTRFVSLVTLAGWGQSTTTAAAKFYAIPEVTYTSDKKDPSILRCTLTVTRWYANNASAGNRLAATPPAITPPAANPPAANPPAANPPAANPPAITPPAANPPAINPPAANPPAAT
ncbi:MAG: hypothetical protein VCA55_02445, partial [Verrucomicrobiales bacterium]